MMILSLLKFEKTGQINNNSLNISQEESESDESDPEDKEKKTTNWDITMENKYRNYKKTAKSTMKSAKPNERAWEKIGLRNCFVKTDKNAKAPNKEFILSVHNIKSVKVI